MQQQQKFNSNIYFTTAVAKIQLCYVLMAFSKKKEKRQKKEDTQATKSDNFFNKHCC